MEKLAKKFEEIIREQYWSWCCTDKELDGSGPIFKPEMIPIASSEYCANECKKIAIDFKTYYMQQPKRIINLVELPDGVSIEDFIRQHDEIEFVKFIENYE